MGRVNATMFGDANLAYMVAKSGELPSDFTRGVWRGGTVGLLVAAVLIHTKPSPLSAGSLDDGCASGGGRTVAQR
jgi:hypothetical protein